MNNFGLKDPIIEKIQTIFSKFDEIESVILYGSRAMGNYKNGSDIDLTIKTKNNNETHFLFKIIHFIEEANLVYKFDISLFSQLQDKELIEHINDRGIEFFNAKKFNLNEGYKEEYQQQKNSYQSEQELENQLIDQLKVLKYEHIPIKDEKDLIHNLKKQIEIHNNISLTDREFEKVLNHLNKGNIFERAEILRDKLQLTKEDGSSIYICFINQMEWCKNTFQVTNQVTMQGEYKNRYDVTILINGLPLCHIELKRRGIELKEAFHQIQRYQKHSFHSSYGLFNYIQIFIISNGVNTKYYANNKKQSFKKTFFWSDQDNNKITQLGEFTKEFLDPCHISKMICRYIVLATVDKILMVLRSYQYYATEKLVERVENSNKNGYIWHTTGSGKTLTSFKASQILVGMPEVKKVVFVVDRKDLDYQTIKEFNSFSDGSVDGTDNTKKLVKKFQDKTQEGKLIVTTIQKLNNAIYKDKHLKKMEHFKDKRIVFIFDECHRSQFGKMRKRIQDHFNNCQLFGFTGTPIFEVNAINKKEENTTTESLFEECLHKYIIVDAIHNENVLRFSVDYISTFKKGSHIREDQVEGIDTKEVLESPERVRQIVKRIISTEHNKKTHNKEFNAIFCVSSIAMLIKYYKAFKGQDHDLKIGSIFSYQMNEEDKSANGIYEEDERGGIDIKHSRNHLEDIIADYNKEYKTNYSTEQKEFYNYYMDIAKRVRKKEMDILIVVNMFLTGFDAPRLNTLYVDKNLKYHTLVQAYSRTNRILNEKKSQGNIVCFRDLKEATDKAITLFSNENANGIVFVKPYEEYVELFNNRLKDLFRISPTVDSLNHHSITEKEELDFVKVFREVLRTFNVLKSFSNFVYDDVEIKEQDFEDYKSKYFDIYEKVKNNKQKEKISILDDIDFELELMRRDEITVTYILELLSKIKDLNKKDREKEIEDILKMVSNSQQLRSKKQLIEEFINHYILSLERFGNLEENYENFMLEAKGKALRKICEEEKLSYERMNKIIISYLYAGHPLEHYRSNIIDSLETTPKLLQRRVVASHIIHKLEEFIEIYES